MPPISQRLSKLLKPNEKGKATRVPRERLESNTSDLENHVNAQQVLVEQSDSSIIGQRQPVPTSKRRDLWEEAFKKLDDDKKQSLSTIKKTSGVDAVQEVADLTEKKYAEYQKGGWKVPHSKGKSVNIRDQAKNVLTSILRFKKLIDTGVAFDPTGHASSAWAILSLGLQMTQNNIDRLQSVFDTSEVLTDTLARYAFIEAHYRDREFDDSIQLERTVIDVYVAILEYCAEIVHQSQLKVPGRALQSLSALSEQPLSELKKKLDAKEASAKTWTNLIEHHYRKEEFNDISRAVDAILANVEGLAKAILCK